MQESSTNRREAEKFVCTSSLVIVFETLTEIRRESYSLSVGM